MAAGGKKVRYHAGTRQSYSMPLQKHLGRSGFSGSGNVKKPLIHPRICPLCSESSVRGGGAEWLAAGSTGRSSDGGVLLPPEEIRTSREYPLKGEITRRCCSGLARKEDDYRASFVTSFPIGSTLSHDCETRERRVGRYLEIQRQGHPRTSPLRYCISRPN